MKFLSTLNSSEILGIVKKKPLVLLESWESLLNFENTSRFCCFAVIKEFKEIKRTGLKLTQLSDYD